MATKNDWHMAPDPFPPKVTVEYLDGEEPKKWTDMFGPPNDGNNVATCAGEFDDIKELGNRIANLDNNQASQLSRYLKECNM